MNRVISYSIAPTALPGVMEIHLSLSCSMSLRFFELQEYLQEIVLELIGGVVSETDNKNFLKHVRDFTSINGRTDLVVRLWN